MPSKITAATAGIVGAQPFGIAAVDAGVVLFGRDGQRQNLLFGQVRKAAAEDRAESMAGLC
jgi:hypothetical protein